MSSFAQDNLHRYFTLLAEAGSELRDMAVETIHYIQNAPVKKKALYAAATVALLGTTAAATSIYGTAEVAIQGLGFAGYAIGLAAARLRYNKHVLSTYPITGGMICVHKALLDAWSYSLMNAVAGVRGGVMSLLPNDAEGQKLRYKVGLGFAAASLPPMIALGIYQSPWSFLNTFAMAANILGDTLTSSEDKTQDKSHYARLLRMSSNTLNLTYSAGYSYSLSSIIFCGLLLRNIGKSIGEYDLPVQDRETDRLLSARESFTRYAAFVVCGKPTEALTRAELKQREIAENVPLPVPAP
jgi:hypothetical protein